MIFEKQSVSTETIFSLSRLTFSQMLLKLRKKETTSLTSVLIVNGFSFLSFAVRPHKTIDSASIVRTCEALFENVNKPLMALQAPMLTMSYKGSSSPLLPSVR